MQDCCRAPCGSNIRDLIPIRIKYQEKPRIKLNHTENERNIKDQRNIKNERNTENERNIKDQRNIKNERNIKNQRNRNKETYEIKKHMK